MVDVIEHNGGSIGWEAGLVQDDLKETADDPNNPTCNEVSEAKTRVREQMLAVSFILGVDCRCYGSMLSDLENSYTQ